MEKYSLERIIGEGSFGRALLVQCISSEQKYVLKEIQLPKNESKLETCRSEAVLLSKMKHVNVVAFREAFEDDNLLCIIMEYCCGGDLLQRIQQQKNVQFPVDDILKWFAQMCAGTKHIHDKRILHRDLKSKNIFLTENGTIKLGDFGSACVLNSSRAFAQTYVGTPYYVAPEIWDSKPYNNKSDVWSLGCVLYELCALRHPFQASSWKSLVLKVCRGAYPPLPKHLPYEMHYLIKQMFKTNPKDRPSLTTILISHRVSKLLRSHLSSEVTESAGQGRHVKRWDPEKGKKVTSFLDKKSLIHTTFSEGVPSSHIHSESDEPHLRKQWAPSDSVLQQLANASLMSSDSVCSASQSRALEEPEVGKHRKRWQMEPPERLLSVLEKAQLNRAFSTFIIHRGSDDPLMGPLFQQQGDDTDGPIQETVDEEHLQPRSDDEDTDFEEESSCDWIKEVEKMFSQQ